MSLTSGPNDKTLPRANAVVLLEVSSAGARATFLIARFVKFNANFPTTL
jgi:hypothetical protein